MSTENKVRLPRKITEQWIEALESGKFKQGTAKLAKHTPNGVTYCCLGVLGSICGVSDDNLIGLSYIDSKPNGWDIDSIESLKLGYPIELTVGGKYEPFMRTLSVYNDNGTHNFHAIASVIRNEVELYDEPEQIEVEKSLVKS